ncbi:hypothetical protein KFL_002730130 [Klebsormidium nitens]|uniref:Rubredoxin-like domain-containing protein n=1 Tax=Klebsormidium nitens TaxID=105231 RepID=A0A1Y1I5C7_KLENI|nr:hypothetical protein KFL_002730130 [Klebsormidium nitens]|eukprot:GAQ86155.1 hypothetical protein KFL_002730130 [Klebsormidium nitens]
MASAVAASAGLSAGALSGCASLRRSVDGGQNANLVPRRVAKLQSGGLNASTTVQALSARTSSQVAAFQPVVETKSAGGRAPPQGPRAAGQAYICQDCGYIYNERKPFDSLPREYSCPVCSSPKRRFKPYTAPVARDANKLDVRKARKAEIKDAGNPLPAVIGGIIVVLAGTYFYLNSTL